MAKVAALGIKNVFDFKWMKITTFMQNRLSQQVPIENAKLWLDFLQIVIRLHFTTFSIIFIAGGNAIL